MGLREYGTLAERYVRDFDAKWLRGGPNARSKTIFSFLILMFSLTETPQGQTAPVGHQAPGEFLTGEWLVDINIEPVNPCLDESPPTHRGA